MLFDRESTIFGLDVIRSVRRRLLEALEVLDISRQHYSLSPIGSCVWTNFLPEGIELARRRPYCYGLCFGGRYAADFFV